MPKIELCAACHQPIDREKDDYVTVAKETTITPEKIAHVNCPLQPPWRKRVKAALSRSASALARYLEK